jgi:hypothetical protein
MTNNSAKQHIETFNAGPVAAGASFVITVVAEGRILSITDNNGNVWVGKKPEPKPTLYTRDIDGNYTEYKP